MKNPKRILVAHTDPHTRRMLTMLLVEAGLSVQAVEPEIAAVTALSEEPFDLALLGQLARDDELFSLALPLREAQPDLPVVMLLPELQLPLVVQGIRHGLTDVLPLRTDPKPVIRRILTLLGLTPDDEPSSAELAEVESTLNQLDPSMVMPDTDEDVAEQRDTLWKGLRNLHLECEVIAAAQAGMDEKARLLREERAEFRREKTELAHEIKEFRAEGAELDAAWREIDEQQKALRLERQNLTKLEQELRRRETESAAFARPPFAPAAPLPGPATDLNHEWAELDRAKLALEAERALFRDERMSLTGLDQKIKQREEQLRDLAEQVKDLDRKRRGLPPPPPKAFAKSRQNRASMAKPSLFRKLIGSRI